VRALGMMLMLAGCDAAAPAPVDAAAPSASTPAHATGARDPHAEVEMPDRPPPPALASADLAGHTKGAERVRIWLQDAGDAGPARLASFLVTDAELIGRLRTAIGFAQKPAPAECARCAAGVRIVFESALGIELGSIDRGCSGSTGPARPAAEGRFFQAASRRCGTIAIADPAALDAIVTEAKQKPAKESQANLP
jgi:hypothetical protein